MIRRLAKSLVPDHALNIYRNWDFNRKLPKQAVKFRAADRNGVPEKDPGTLAALEASLAWVCRAQDCSLTGDGGVARHFSLIEGWSASYPETTGYIVPTLIASGHALKRQEYINRARRMLDWFIGIQFEDGGFQGGMVTSEPKVPTTFNTGQILIGLAAGAEFFGDRRYFDSMIRAGKWLRNTQDEDGCWRCFGSPFAKAGEKAYETHVSWGLFEAARVSGDRSFGDAGIKQVYWALSKQWPNGWFADCCLDDSTRPLTHTLGYVLRGILEAYRYQPDPPLLDAAYRTGRATLDCQEPDGFLAGRFDANWSPAVSWACLTGSVQLAICWFRLYELTDEQAFLAGARRANSFVRRTIQTDGNPNWCGGVKGSFPVDGEYGKFEFLNWAAKFFIDSNLYEIDLVDCAGGSE